MAGMDEKFQRLLSESTKKPNIIKNYGERKMYCPKCGAENPDDAKVCRSCSSDLPKAPVTTKDIIPKMSGLAIAAFVLGILSIFTLGITIIPAVILGIAAIIVIEKSGGRLTGRGFAVLGIVIPVIVFLAMFVLLIPTFIKERQTDFRMVCGMNLGGIGKAMTIYANDYDGELPRAGGTNSVWAGKIPDWMAVNRFDAYGLRADGNGGQASISSCFYLLVKYTDVTPKTFICKGDAGATAFKPADEGLSDRELIELWDFGPYTNAQDNPGNHCSYSYHQPFSPYPLTTSSEPGMAVAADRNPWIDSPFLTAKDYSFFSITGREGIKAGNAMQHKNEGQNVLFLDTHVYFKKSPFCGIKDDNIYTYWDGGDIRKGSPPKYGSIPQHRIDSLLVHDGEGGGGGGPFKGRACFLAEIPVLINGSLVQISKVAAGQTVNALASATIEKLEEHEGTFECRDIVLESGNCISVVESHLFMLESGQWVTAQQLRSGLKLKTLNGTVEIKSVTTRAMPYVGKVYNLKVSSSDQYMVSDDAVIVRDY